MDLVALISIIPTNERAKSVLNVSYLAPILWDNNMLDAKYVLPNQTQSWALVVDSLEDLSLERPRVVPTSPATWSRPPSAKVGMLRPPPVPPSARTGFSRNAYTTHDTTNTCKWNKL
jgi:hypothetical protein